VPRPRALLQLARPKQWVKNLLVFAAPGAAGVLSHGSSFTKTCLAFAAFCLAASGTYAWNDARDAEADRRHPKKCNRPVATGAVSVAQAQVFGAVLFAASLVVAAITTAQLLITVLVYVALTVAYTLRLKHEPVLDLVTVAACYVIRTVGGATATHVRVSTWFLIVAAAGSLFVVTGKRSAEVHRLGADAAHHRRALAGYTHEFLLYVRGVSSSVAIVAYCLWAFEFSEGTGNAVWFQSSIVPFVIGILRYSLLLEAGEGGAPEDLLLSDPVLVVVGLVWVGVFATAVYYK
jgi:decaprenyl-phosphate phosphoribosyltransferase